MKHAALKIAIILILAYAMHPSLSFAQTLTPTPPSSSLKADAAGEEIDLTTAATWLVTQTKKIPLFGDKIVKLVSGLMLKDQTYNFSDMEDEGKWLENANQKLLPQALQDREVDFTNPQYKQITSRLCVFDPEDQTKLKINEPSKEGNIIKSPDQPYIRKLVQHGETYNALFNPKASLENLDHERLTLELSAESARECGETDTGGDMKTTSKQGEGENKYLTSGNPVEVVVAFLQKYITKIEQIEKSLFRIEAKTSVPAYIQVSSANPYAQDHFCNIAGCKKEDIESASATNEEKDMLSKKGGFVETFIPASLSYKETLNANEENTFNTLGGETISENTTTTRSYLDKGTSDALTALKCALLPASKQGEFLKGKTCKFAQGSKAPEAGDNCGSCTTANAFCEEAGLAPLTGSQSLGCNYNVSSIEGPPTLKDMMKKASDYFGVPPQIFAAILHIETNAGYGYSDSQVQEHSRTGNYDPAQCAANRCGAVGPVQLSIKACDYSQCPRAEQSKNWEEWCSFRSGANDVRNDQNYSPNPSNFLDAFAALAKKLQYLGNNTSCGAWPEETVKYISCSYFGSCEASEARDWFYEFLSQYTTNPGLYAKTVPNKLTYGEFVWGYYMTH